MDALYPNLFRATKLIKIPLLWSVSAAMHIVKEGNEVIVIDPFVLPDAEKEALEQLGKPTAILLTTTFHVRDAEQYRSRYGAKVFANRAAVPKLGIPVDEAFGDGDSLPGNLKAIEMTGTSPGETILQHNLEKSGLITGDALFNLQKGETNAVIRLLGFRENLNPMPKLIIKDKKRAAEAYQRLLDYDFDQILVSHGAPILSGAKEQLRAMLKGGRK